MANGYIYRQFIEELERTLDSREDKRMRIGAELKFPLVEPGGAAVNINKVNLLWDYLEGCGWTKDIDGGTKECVGCRVEGLQNFTVASTETGYAKTEFSMAHQENLFKLDDSIKELRACLREFSREQDVYFLCFGIHPVSPPGRRLMIKKTRTSVWDKIFKSNRHVPAEDGDDMHLFTLNAASHVHISVPMRDMVPLVNALNGFSGAQIALTANSNIWKGRLDERYKCAAEKFWDWWIPEKNRTGVPAKPFASLEDYVDTVSSFKPVYVKRENGPVLLPGYDSFRDYYNSGRAEGVDIHGGKVAVEPDPSDIQLHNTLYWYNARISGYFTVENRIHDQQPADSLLVPSALTLGLANAIEESLEVLAGYAWEELRSAREKACERALEDGMLKELAGRMLKAASAGLSRRGLGEEVFLEPLYERLERGTSPADEAKNIFLAGGIAALIERRKL